MTSEKISSNEPNTTPSQWDTLAEPADVPSSANPNTAPNTTPKTPEVFAKEFAGHVRDIQIDFAAALKHYKENGETHLPREAFEKYWEDDYRDLWKNMESETRQAIRGDLTVKDPMAKEAELEESVVVYLKDSELYQTIEAQAGHYYDERSTALLGAIRKSDDPNKEQDLEYARSFRHAVLAHLDYKYMNGNGGWQSGDASYYDRARTRAHNDVIKRLNGLNALAEKYHTRRFTPRDFWTSENQSQTPAMSRRMRYDRDIVEEYYAIAFAYEEEEKKKEQERESRFY